MSSPHSHDGNHGNKFDTKEKESGKYDACLIASGKLLCGYYHQWKRNTDVMAKFLVATEKLKTIDLSKDKQHYNEEMCYDKNERPLASRKDKSVEEIWKEIKELFKEADEVTFENEHFNREYRTLQGTCWKLLGQLDNFDWKGDANLKARKEEAIQEVQYIEGLLRSKVHSDGNCCPNCPLYNTMWG